MKIAMISARYAPETSPGAKRATDLAAALRRAGHDTVVLTQLPNYPDPTAYADVLEGARRRTIGTDDAGNPTWRFRPNIVAKENLWGRLMAEARFATRASIANTRLRKLDGIVASTPFMFNVVSARSYQVPMWLDLRDLTWEYTAGLGNASRLKRVGAAILKQVVLSSFRTAAGISTTTERQRQYLIDHGVPARRVRTVPNGVPQAIVDRLAEIPAPGEHHDPIRVVYAGLLGFPQGLEFAVDTIAQFPPDMVELHLYGDGVDRARIAERCRAERIHNVFVHGHIPYERYLTALRDADILYASLRAEGGLASAMPSKVWEYMAAEKPVLFAGSGEAPDAIRRSGGGLAVDYGDGAALRHAVRRLVTDPDLREELGTKGRQWVLAHQIREKINEEWVDVLEDTFGAGTAATIAPVQPHDQHHDQTTELPAEEPAW